MFVKSLLFSVQTLTRLIPIITEGGSSLFPCHRWGNWGSELLRLKSKTCLETVRKWSNYSSKPGFLIWAPTIFFSFQKDNAIYFLGKFCIDQYIFRESYLNTKLPFKDYAILKKKGKKWNAVSEVS